MFDRTGNYRRPRCLVTLVSGMAVRDRCGNWFRIVCPCPLRPSERFHLEDMTTGNAISLPKTLIASWCGIQW